MLVRLPSKQIPKEMGRRTNGWKDKPKHKSGTNKGKRRRESPKLDRGREARSETPRNPQQGISTEGESHQQLSS